MAEFFKVKATAMVLCRYQHKLENSTMRGGGTLLPRDSPNKSVDVLKYARPLIRATHEPDELFRL